MLLQTNDKKMVYELMLIFQLHWYLREKTVEKCAFIQ